MIAAAWAAIGSVIAIIASILGWLTLAWLVIGFTYAWWRQHRSRRVARAAARQAAKARHPSSLAQQPRQPDPVFDALLDDHPELHDLKDRK
ncbi:hypothetical protein ACIBH1_45445 [Nonomuraea sp. NPDC050663]|uniref:hypothetical protein n=1 Tax=Nonomuraea sp. NPDC050663 TaxID=3364370 RepID=UPI0037B5819E